MTSTRRPSLSEMTPVHVDDKVIERIQEIAAKLGFKDWNDVIRLAVDLPVEVECPRCLGEARELSGPPGWYVLGSPCKQCGGEGTEPRE